MEDLPVTRPQPVNITRLISDWDRSFHPQTRPYDFDGTKSTPRTYHPERRVPL